MTKHENGILDATLSGGIKGGPSFSLRHRIFRAVWNLTWWVLASWTPPPLHKWRVLLLRLFGAKIRKGARVWGSTRVWYPPNLQMGDYAVLGWKVNCYNQGMVVLEDFAIVSQYSHLVTGSHEIDDPSFQLYTKPIRVCKNAWLASDCFVGPGVTIGQGAVLGARGVTFKDLEPWTVYVGNPAGPIRTRKQFTR